MREVRAIMKYPGSKWSMANWIISYFPEHHSYLEPFAGSLAVLLNKPRSNIETVNDLDGNVVNLFEWIKKDPERLAHEIYYTPYARQVYETAYQTVPEGQKVYSQEELFDFWESGYITSSARFDQYRDKLQAALKPAEEQTPSEAMLEMLEKIIKGLHTEKSFMEEEQEEKGEKQIFI